MSSGVSLKYASLGNWKRAVYIIYILYSCKHVDSDNNMYMYSDFEQSVRTDKCWMGDNVLFPYRNIENLRSSARKNSTKFNKPCTIIIIRKLTIFFSNCVSRALPVSTTAVHAKIKTKTGILYY